jgi:hypothetical protein
MNRHANRADFYMAGCALLPLPLLLTFGPIAALGAMVVLLGLGCYHGGMEQAETGEGPLFGSGLDGPQPAPAKRTETASDRTRQE